MCGIAGFYNPNISFEENRSYYHRLLSEMADALQKRGPDSNGTYLNAHFGLVHTRLSIIDLLTGQQPILCRFAECVYGISYNGELYNTQELRSHLQKEGFTFRTTSDAEVVLLCYIHYGESFVQQLNGVFAFAIMDIRQNQLLLYRDRCGIKPLFYSYKDANLIFASELKGLFTHPSLHPILSKSGFNEIFSLGPAKTPGCGVFEGIHEVLPAHYLKVSPTGMQEICYWQLEAAEHTDDYSTTLEKTRFLVTDSIKRQMISDVPIATFLSGGVDSSIVSAVCAQELAKKRVPLSTFSFDFEANQLFFQENDFQPSQDFPYVQKMISFLDSKHQFLECSNQNLFDYLKDSVLAHDLPAMGDIDSSLLYFCSIVKNTNKVVLTGECADEIFGGYPWFHKESMLSQNTFPWTPDLSFRKFLLSDDLISTLDMDAYVASAYEDSLSKVPRLKGESALEDRRREISFLNLRWFMQTLLDRMDRTSMYCGLEARVPFADHRILEYLYNVPWEMKAKNGVVKGLLRDACKGLLPDEILYRKKSPYPKTYNPAYEHLLKNAVTKVLQDSSSPILPFLNSDHLASFLETPADYVKPWYGQLMAGPQMLAYLLQINFWLSEYHITIAL